MIGSIRLGYPYSGISPYQERRNQFIYHLIYLKQLIIITYIVIDIRMSIILHYQANAGTNELVLSVLTRELIMLLIASYEQELMNTLKEQTK